MKHQVVTFASEFAVVTGNARSQSAVMVVSPGKSEGGADNRHRGAGQWLFVVAGSGLAVVDGRDVELRVGSLLLIEAGERHEIKNTGPTALQTLNFYLPPAYDAEGETLPAGQA